MALLNPFGELGLEGTLQKISLYLHQLASTLGRVYPDTAGNLRVSVSSGTVTSVTTVANVASVGGFGAQYDQYAQVQVGANSVRAQIVVS